MDSGPSEHDKRRCEWALGDPLMLRYHDQEWGTPRFDDRHLFEFLILEGAQAGLSWLTILKRREDYRRGFAGFDPHRVATFSRERIESLLRDPGIIRNRRKVESAVTNARIFLNVLEEYGDFATYLRRFLPDMPRHNRWTSLQGIPASTPESRALAKDLKRRGASFVGEIICYAFMQAVGMVNDHVTGCYRYTELLQK